jgi:hypothetical protein
LPVHERDAADGACVVTRPMLGPSMTRPMSA